MYIKIQKEVNLMKMCKLLIHLPHSLKRKLEGLRAQGYTASGFIRALLVREFNQPTKKGG